MGSHLESYWLTDVNRLVPFYEFFLSEFTNPDKYSQFDGQVWKQLLSLTLWQCQVAVLKSIPRAWFCHEFWAILISVGVKLEAFSLVQWLSMNDRCQL